MWKKPIAISLAPNLTIKDVLISLKYLLVPFAWFKWKRGQYLSPAEQKMNKVLGSKTNKIFLLDKARTGLYLLWKTLNIKEGDEVLIQAYTCVVIPNSLLWTGAKPVYVDIDPETLNIDPEKVRQKITSRTRAILIQHTMGYPADMDKILRIAKEYKLKIIEDCAHTLGSKHKGQILGTIGDAAVFTFGRDKAISTVNGGALSINDKDLAVAVEKTYKNLPFPDTITIFRCLFHSVAFAFILPLYDFFNIGKICLVLFQKIGVLEKVYTKEERLGGGRPCIAARMPNCLAEILLNQLKCLPKFNHNRIVRADQYQKNLESFKGIKLINKFTYQTVLLRFTILVDDPKGLLKAAQKGKILLGDWYSTAIMPAEVDYSKIYYQAGQCPMAEYIASKTVNLPLGYRIGELEAEKILELVKRFVKKNL